MMDRLGGVTGVQMIVVLLITASPNLAKQLQVICYALVAAKRSKSGIKTLYLNTEE
ncbi:hypothetical protein L580_1975 [Serratia fonticola AU-P3(3)]|nr:hypothetical protein L580_1975 [Serratia fonticola AU-P3(3)]